MCLINKKFQHFEVFRFRILEVKNSSGPQIEIFLFPCQILAVIGFPFAFIQLFPN